MHVQLPVHGRGAVVQPEHAGTAVRRRILRLRRSVEGPIFIEDSVTDLRIVSADGEQILNGLRPIDTLDVPLFDRAVPEGSYHVSAVERPCAGNCDILDPPVEETRCEVEVDVRANRTTRVATVLRPTAIAPKQPAARRRALPRYRCRVLRERGWHDAAAVRPERSGEHQLLATRGNIRGNIQIVRWVHIVHTAGRYGRSSAV